MRPPMPDDTNASMPVWIVKFFRDLRSLAPTRIGYISHTSEAGVQKLALERMADEEACRIEICRVILHPLILADGAEYWLD